MTRPEPRDHWTELNDALAALAAEIRKPFAWLLDRLTWLTR